MRVLVVNSGSSSIKFDLFDMTKERVLVEGEVEAIGLAEPRLISGDGTAPRVVKAADHRQAMQVVLSALREAESGDGDLGDIAAVGHRVVHGGARFLAPVRIDEDVMRGIRELEVLAPVHTKANVAGIEAALAVFPDACHVAVFDTSFHQTLPPVAREYALPRDITTRLGIRRYGFHGTSHAYVAQRAAGLLGTPPTSVNLISLHLGNGASVTAIRRGMSVDTSMGMTPLEGLVMGTRCGDIDPAVPGLLGEFSQLSREDVNRLLNFESGLKGVCGESDMRAVHALSESGDEDAALAIDMFCYRAKKYIGAYFAVLGWVDALIFTGGIGENDADVRSRICDGLERLGVLLDDSRNSADAAGERRISGESGHVAVFVIPTHEELELARAAFACLSHAFD